MKNRFYTFSSVCSSQYVSVIDILNSSDFIYSICDKCDADKLIKWGEVIPIFECETVTKNRKLPDIMLYGGRMLQTFSKWSIVSKNVKRLIENEKLTGVCFYPAELVSKIRGKCYKIDEKYYIMSVIGKAEIDFEAMGINCSLCEICEHYVFEGKICSLFTRNGIYPTLLKNNKWDGTDIFTGNCCTERFVQKILESNLSGFKFLRLEQKYDAFEKKVFSNIERIKRDSRNMN